LYFIYIGVYEIPWLCGAALQNKYAVVSSNDN
jgi:hypothetical protein